MSPELCGYLYLAGAVLGIVGGLIWAGYEKGRTGKADEDNIGPVVVLALFWPLALSIALVIGAFAGIHFLFFGLGEYLGERAKHRAEGRHARLSSAESEIRTLKRQIAAWEKKVNTVPPAWD